MGLISFLDADLYHRDDRYLVDEIRGYLSEYPAVCCGVRRQFGQVFRNPLKRFER
jgi:hypothetical protein